ncbi:snurportin-1-like isoform X2 [Choristoneura fumiferana]|uniref:snurportin-1-like isoform X2 n=1 Tax=Choristoneura fumiferana TaxID=7141 RepID=UPI003D158F6E
MRRKKQAHYRPNIYVAGFHKAPATYNNVLMLSEWIIEKPIDFNEDWYVVPCPKGVRVLLVAYGGTTKTYTKYGHFRQEFRSALPGGNPCDPTKNRCCVLDCFYSDQNKIMYVLDLLAWNNQPMTDGEMEFRQYWLKSQLTDMPELTTINKKNKMVFQLLPMVPCTPESFNKFMMTCPQFEGDVPKLDGLLFYHKKAHYVSGETPLVGWLFPYMVPEVLGSEITVHEQYMSAKPTGYVNQAEFIQAFEAMLDKKRPKSRRASSAMDTSDSKETEKNNMNEQQTAQEHQTDNPSVVPELMEAEERNCMETVKGNGELDKEHVESVEESMEADKEHMESVEESMEADKEHVESVKESMEADKEHVDSVKEGMEADKEHVESVKESVEVDKEHVKPIKESCMEPAKEHTNQQLTH